MSGNHDLDQDFESFLSFYKENKISPVSQDISDLTKHYKRRDYLYRSLGIPPTAVASKSIIEFGSGSGHNALFTTHLKPSRYVLVDANPNGLDAAQELLQQYFSRAQCHEFVQSRIQDFSTDERFDLVLCEGVIPHQLNPAQFAKHVSQFVKPGGILVITTADYVSVCAEILRRLIRDTILDPRASVDRQCAVLRPVFEPHLQTLAGMSRPVDDWIMDNIAHPWKNPLFSIDEAIGALGGDFDTYGSSPKFMTDWRWYKNPDTEIQDVNRQAIDNYRQHSLAFLDYRFVPNDVDEMTCRQVTESCKDLYDLMISIENSKDLSRFGDVADICTHVAELVAQILPETSASIQEAARYFNDPAAHDPKSFFHLFTPFFGRAQQYLSLVRRYL